MAIETALSYPEISAQGFAHPADRAAAAALHSVPMLDRVIKKLTEASYERVARQLMLGNSVRLGEDQLPKVWAMQRGAAHTFDITPCPALYVTQFPVGNGSTIGANEPVTLISSGLASSFDNDELHAVLAHEMGHVLADHVSLLTTLKLVEWILSGAVGGNTFHRPAPAGGLLRLARVVPGSRAHRRPGERPRYGGPAFDLSDLDAHGGRSGAGP